MIAKRHKDGILWAFEQTASMEADRIRRQGIAGQDATEAKALYASGYSPAQIASMVGLSQLDVNLAIGRYGGGV